MITLYILLALYRLRNTIRTEFVPKHLPIEGERPSTCRVSKYGNDLGPVHGKPESGSRLRLHYVFHSFAFSIFNMASEASSWTVIAEDNAETPSTSDLRSALQKGSDDVKLDTLRKIIVSTINGNPQVYFVTYVIAK